jgi:alpha-1,2-mannosyltransferase
MMLFLLKFVISVIALLAAFVLLPQFPLGLLRLVLRGVGWVIRKRTQARRAAILARGRTDEEELLSKQPKTTSTNTASADDEDWEKVDTSNGSNSGESSGVSGSQTSRQSKNDDWAGIIGFFHPFW